MTIQSARYETTISTDANGIAAAAECDKKRKATSDEYSICLLESE